MTRWSCQETADAPQSYADGAVDNVAINTFELHEMRLRASSDRVAAAKALADQAGPDGLSVPLLSSIEDARDVALLRAVRAGDAPDGDMSAVLSPYVTSRQPVRYYRSRLALDSADRASYYRLAVTESGINDRAAPADPQRTPPVHGNHAGIAARRLWIGAPVDSYGGLLVLVGHAEEGGFSADRETTSWPLPLSADLGVRIYAGGRELSKEAA